MESKKINWKSNSESIVDSLVIKPYWYKIEHDECPVCGKRDTYKERQYTTKPDDYNKRIIIKQVYDHCMESAL